MITRQHRSTGSPRRALHSEVLVRFHASAVSEELRSKQGPVARYVAVRHSFMLFEQIENITTTARRLLLSEIPVGLDKLPQHVGQDSGASRIPRSADTRDASRSPTTASFQLKSNGEENSKRHFQLIGRHSSSFAFVQRKGDLSVSLIRRSASATYEWTCSCATRVRETPREEPSSAQKVASGCTKLCKSDCSRSRLTKINRLSALMTLPHSGDGLSPRIANGLCGVRRFIGADYSLSVHAETKKMHFTWILCLEWPRKTMNFVSKSHGVLNNKNDGTDRVHMTFLSTRLRRWFDIFLIISGLPDGGWIGVGKVLRWNLHTNLRELVVFTIHNSRTHFPICNPIN